MNLVVLGPAGSGKGTLALWLREKFHLAHFETGAELRRVSREDTPSGRELRKALQGGNMADTALVMRILKEALSHQPAGTTGWLLDGIPRKPEQAVPFLDLVRDGTVPLQAVVVLEGSRERLRERLLGRQTCESCGEIYNEKSRPSPSPGRCTAACGGVLGVRDDDTPEGIQQRFELYERQTVPTIEILREAGLPLITLDTDHHRIEEVRAKVLQALRRLTQAGEPPRQPPGRVSFRAR